jgi:cell division protein FtsW (lipid II flippase)
MKRRPRPNARAAAHSPAAYLLALAATVAATGSVWLVRFAQAPVVDARAAGLAAVYVISLGASWAVVRRFAPGSSPILAPAGLLLAGLGLAMGFRMSGSFSMPLSSLIAFPAGVASMLLIVMLFGRGRAGALAAFRWPAWGGAVAVMLLVVVAGRRFRGTLFLPGQINPTEILKPLLAVFTAGFLARAQDGGRKADPDASRLLACAALWLVPMAGLLVQRDLGMLVLMGVALVVAFYAATPRPYWLLPALAAIPTAIALFRLTSHGRRRVELWLDPFADETGAGWQILQGLSALYSGGWWGSGVGAGFPHAVPIAASDFIYAAIGEELGFVGCALLVAVYGALFAAGFAAAARAPGRFERVLAAVLTAFLAAQTIWNLGGVTKALPMTGIPLPFLSRGGSDLTASFVMLGLLIVLSDRAGGKARDG